MKRRVLAILMSSALVAAALAGCGSSDSGSSSSASTAAAETEAAEDDAAAETSEAAEETAEAEAPAEAAATDYALDKSWPEETVMIGVECYDTTDEQFLAIQNYFDYLTEYYNISFMYSESIADAEGELNFIDSCASAGCKGIFGYYNVAGAQAIQEAIDQGMYYWGTEQYYGDFENNDHYVGCYTFIEDGDTENGDYLGGYQLGYSLGEQGIQHVFYCNGGASMGIQMFLDRQAGFEAGIAAAQADGYAIQYDPSSDVVEGWPGTDDFTAAVGTKLASDYDGAAVSFNAAALFQPIYDANKADSIHVATIGEVSDTYYDAVQSGMISTVVYDCEEVVFANGLVQLLNAITGHYDVTQNDDGTAGKILTSRWTITDAESYDAIYEYHDDGNFFVSAEDFAGLLADLNPSVTHDEIQSFYGSYTLEGALATIQ